MGNLIHIHGARQHNLKNITLDIPRDELVVICGPSGSGKSTLAFDIIYAEGQRRYVESLSAYARQFLPQMDKPDVDKIEGLSPAISLEQQAGSRNPRSTVGTVTEIHDFLRVFFARLGVPYCPRCNVPIAAQTGDQIISALLDMPEGERFQILAPLVEHQKGAHAERLKKLRKQGFVRVRVDGVMHTMEQLPVIDPKRKHTIELVVDRLVQKPDLRRRLADSVELALDQGGGKLLVLRGDGREELYSTAAVCAGCGLSLPVPSPQLFSFNSPQGACPQCSGIGAVEYYEPALVAPNRGLSLLQGAVIPWKNPRVLARHREKLEALVAAHGLSLSTPLADYPEPALRALFQGDEELSWPGIVALLEQADNMGSIWRDELARFRQTMPCPACDGARLKPEALAVRVHDLNIHQLCLLSIGRALEWMNNLEFPVSRRPVADPLVKELSHRLGFLADVGLEYLNLARTMSTLSGGEAQRIRLASQLGSGLVGVTYVLDEPSIGLHPRDNERLLRTLRQLQERGNTVLVVEHDEETIRAADTILELGPGSGALGGEVVFSGNLEGLLAAPDSLTGKYLRGDLTIPRPENPRRPEHALVVEHAVTNNLKDVTCAFPLHCLTCVTGVSGSGKSSLVIDTLYKHIALSRGLKVDFPGRIQGIRGLERIEKIVSIDQTPIGRTPRSNPATYTKIFDEIRTIFASTKESRKRGYKPGRFSFNVRGGRCEACRGDGQIRVEMHFLPDVFITCEVCGGKRYNRETLDVTWQGLNIAQVLDLSVRQARDLFTAHVALKRKLDLLSEVGLDYLRLGQPATTLSGGEAQRIKICRELSKKRLPGTLYVLDEPTTGLHMHEVGKLIHVLHTLVDRGASVIVIEHNPHVILASDHVIDLGPGGGEYGGRIVASGTPAEIMADPDSVTGRFLLP